MKKTLALILCVATMAGLFTACGTPKASAGVVNVYNWGEYIDEDIFADFTAQTGIQVNYNVFEHNEAMYATLKSGGANHDVVIPSDYMISRMIEEDMLETLDFSGIPNFSDVEPGLKNPEYDPTNEYSIPYMWGTVGIIYNTTKVNKPVTDWDSLFDPDYKGQILMFDNSRDALGIALKSLGHPYNTTDKAHISQAVDLLIEQKPLVQAYVMDQIFEKLESGEAAIGPYYAGDYLTMVQTNPDLAFCFPEEGTNRFVDAMCIPKGAPNKSNAEAFINFMCSKEAGLANCEAIGYSTPLLTVKDALPEELRTSEVAYPGAEVLANTETFTNLPVDILSFYDSEWLRLKT